MRTEQIYQLFLESDGISTDSRSTGNNQIFFALWGGNFNGNKFAQDAIDRGAAFAVIDDPVFESDKTILVDDCLMELQALAAHHRKQLNIPVLAITGTNGKTTTKELLAAILSRKLNVHYTRGNQNNHIGVPLTILSAPAGTRMMIVEMGANHIGEIRSLCQIARPDFGIITNIGMAHIEGFGSFEGVVRAKTELYEYLRKVNGVALYNDKDPLLTEKIFKHVNRAVPFSDPTGTLLFMEAEPSDMSLAVKVKYNHSEWRIKTNLFGRYNYWNLKAAVATALFFEVDMNDIVAAVEEYKPANNRSQVRVTGRNTIICDSYNANPVSMHTALQSFATAAGEPRMVILGDMLELGEKSEEEHIKILDEIATYPFREVLLAGKIFQKVCRERNVKAFPDTGTLMDHLRNNPVKGYTILVKGSRGIGLEKVYDLL
jgi:UDP-N-acetylmuramoyl-tripeptide--D-alanyl-D-alanine ligase